MTPEEVAREMLRAVCAEFLLTGEPTSRRTLISRYPRQRDVLEELIQRGFLRTGQTTQEYFPSAAAFANTQDPNLVHIAKDAVISTLKVLRLLYENTDD